jgi:hypothetical protein
MSMKAKWFAAAVAVVAFVAVGAAQATKSAAPTQAKEPAAKAETWAGKISDSGCNANKHTMGKDEADCVAMCVKGGKAYVFVADKDSKVLKIGNQKFAGLVTHAGHHVELTGTLKDDTITVTKIVMPAKK